MSSHPTRGNRASWRWLVATVLVVIGAFIGASGAFAAAPKALVNGDTVAGGASSPEAIAASNQGYAVTVVGGATWLSMSQSDFGQYDLLIAGDPNCSGLAGSMTASAATWGPVVMGTAGGRTFAGNRVVIGTDPVLHGGNATNDRGRIIRTGIKYAGQQPNTTGLYLDLSCDYSSHVASIAMLDKITTDPGHWSESNDAPCGGNVSLIASNPSFADLTSSSLAGWGCSVHEVFPSFPSDWNPLAVATDTAAKPVCGVDPNTGASACGQPYVLISGSSVVVVSGSISVAPLTGSAPVGTSHTVSAHVTAGGSPLVGQLIKWTVTGINAGAVGTCVPAGCVTDASGDVSFTYTGGAAPGSDTIKASFTDARGSLQAATAAMDWTKPLDADLSVTKSAPASAPWGAPVSTTITVHNAGPAAATGVVVTDTITGGTFVSGAGCTASAGVVTCTVGNLAVGANATFAIASTTTGAGTLADTAHVAGGQADLALGNNDASASTAILAHPTALALDAVPGPITAGSPVTLSATLTDAGSPVAGQPVTLGLGGSQSCTATTDAAGSAACSVVVDQPVGAAAISASFAGNANYGASSDSGSVAVNHATAIAYTGATTADYHDGATLSAKLTDAYTGAPLAGKSVLLVVGAQTCSDATNAAGVASCSITINQVPSTYVAIATFTGTPSYIGSTDAASFTVTPEQTTIVYTGATGYVANGSTVTLSGVLKEDGVTAIAGRSVTLWLGGQTCTDTTNAAGVASCSIVVSQATGAVVTGAAFAGDATYLPASDTGSAFVFGWAPGGGAFVVGNGSASGTVNFWGPQWWKTNTVSGGSAPSSFKGYALNPSLPSCGTAWKTDPANSTPPPAGPLPTYMAVLVTSSVSKSGAQISGNTVKVVIVKTDGKYGPTVGQAGGGTVVGTLCS